MDLPDVSIDINDKVLAVSVQKHISDRGVFR